MWSEKERKVPRIGHHIRVLIVEDSEDDTELMIRCLRKGGFNPKFKRVQTAKGLLKAVKNEKWDIVLCDHNMPGFDSISAIEIINELRPDIPFMLISDSISNGFAETITKKGARAAIPKSNLRQLVPLVVRELKAARNMKKNKNTEQQYYPNGISNKGTNPNSNGNKISLLAADMSGMDRSLPVEDENKKHNDGLANNNNEENSHPVKNILIVEDELIQSILLEKLIKSLGYKVIGKATTGADAIDKALALQPDLITMDISLQDDIDGIMATKSIQDKSMIPVIYISGNSDKYNFERAEKTNFIDFIPKPVSKESLAKSFIKAESIEIRKK